MKLRIIVLFCWLPWLLLACQSVTTEVPETHITGSGTLEGRDVVVASELGGRIDALLVQEGDTVDAGETLLRLDDAEARAQYLQARAAEAAADANLAKVRAGPRPEELRAARARVDQAKAQTEGAGKALLHAQEAISNPVELDLQIAQARTQVALSEQQVEDAKVSLDAEKFGYHIYVDLKDDVSADTRRMWDLRLEAAQDAITRAEAELEAAQADFNALLALRANPLEARARLHAAEAVYTATQAALLQAQAELVALRTQPRPESVTTARAQALQAHASLTMTLTQLDMLTLTAPISGVVVACDYYTGEIAPQGLPLLTLANLDTLYLTLYVPQSRLDEVYLGQAVEITVDTYVDKVFQGTVEHIAGKAEFTPNNVTTADDRARLVFAVEIRVPNPDQKLRPGMPANGIFQP